MQLTHSKREVEYLSPAGEVICMAPNVWHHTRSHLLVKKEEFLCFLRENDLCLLWTVISEKQIIGRMRSTPEYQNPGRLEYSAAWYPENQKPTGHIQSHTSR